MSRRRFAAALLAVTALAAAPVGAGEDALTDLSGRRLENGSFHRGTVIAVFMATWSPRCRDVVSRVEAIEERWGERARVLMISFQEQASQVEEFLDGKATVEVYLDPDGAFSKEHLITFLPGLLVLQDGGVAYRGRLGSDPDDILAQLLE